MRPATAPRAEDSPQRLLRIDPHARSFVDGRMADLPALVRAHDILVLNDAATLPASLAGVDRSGAAVEVRLAGSRPGGLWTGVLFGAGDWRTRTELRPAPAPPSPGDVLSFGTELTACVVGVSGPGGRVLELRFAEEGAAFWSALYRWGRPVQYAYLAAPLRLAQVQTAFASRPWAMEAPSAGRPLTWVLLKELKRRGAQIASVTHAAGLSSIGDPRADALLPFDERYDVPSRTVDAVQRARAHGGRVIAVGTTVVRALESAGAHGVLVPGEGHTNLRIGPSWQLRVVDGLLTGMHEPGTSHFALATAFAPEDLLLAAHRHAEAEGYLAHEFGDSTLILRA